MQPMASTSAWPSSRCFQRAPVDAPSRGVVRRRRACRHSKCRRCLSSNECAMHTCPPCDVLLHPLRAMLTTGVSWLEWAVRPALIESAWLECSSGSPVPWRMDIVGWPKLSPSSCSCISNGTEPDLEVKNSKSLSARSVGDLHPPISMESPDAMCDDGSMGRGSLCSGARK